MSKVVNIKSSKKKIKLKDLRPFLRNDRINLYLEPNKPIKYELWGIDDENGGLAEYRPLDDYDEPRKNDTMFLDYGDYTIEKIDVEPIKKEGLSLNEEGTLAICICK